MASQNATTSCHSINAIKLWNNNFAADDCNSNSRPAVRASNHGNDSFNNDNNNGTTELEEGENIIHLLNELPYWPVSACPIDTARQLCYCYTHTVARPARLNENERDENTGQSDSVATVQLSRFIQFKQKYLFGKETCRNSMHFVFNSHTSLANKNKNLHMLHVYNVKI